MTDATLWSGGRVFTGERYVDALLVEDGRVVVAGPIEEALRAAPTGVEREDLGGRLIVPGLVDAHLHLGELAREGPELSRTRSFAALRDLLSVWAATHPDGPVVGRGWETERLGEGRPPTLRDIDAIAPGRPLVLYHASGHAALLSSSALEVVGGRAALEPLPSEMVGRFPDGSPNGLLFEDALRPISRRLEETTPFPVEALDRVLRTLAAFGITRVGTMSTAPREAAALRELAAGGRLAVTVRAYPRLAQLDEYSDALLSWRTDRFAIVGVKTYLDGAFGPRTASLSEPYRDEPTTSGVALGDDGALVRELSRAAGRGLAPALHAIGDRAIERAARLLEPWSRTAGPPPRIEHVSLTPPATLRELERVRPTLVVQPGFLWSDVWLADRLGPGRSRWAYLFRTLLDRGHAVAGSSDAPYDPIDPWRGIRAAVRRRDPLGRSANPLPSEALSPEEALTLYTIRGAAALGDPSEGKLVSGSAADLVVLEASRLSAAIEAAGLPVRETWVSGRRLPPVAVGETV